MAQVNNSQPYHPVITFQVNLNTVNSNSFLTPTQYQQSPDRGRTENAALANTRVTYFPGLLAANNMELYNNGTFTLYGVQAQYYRAEIAKGNFPELTIISQT